MAGNKISRIVPLPMDIKVSMDKETVKYARLKPEENHASFNSNLPEGIRPLSLEGESGKSDDETYWIDDEGLAQWQAGKMPDVFKTDALYQVEDRVGLAMDHTRRTYKRIREDASEGLFYRARFVRPHEGVGLLTAVSPLLLPETGTRRPFGTFVMGGESHIGRYQMVDYTPPKPSALRGRVKIVLLTPAYFVSGWQPASWSAFGEKAQLVSAVIGKPQPVGGWDLHRGDHKPMVNYVPAGSVYFLDGVSQIPSQVTDSPRDSLDHQALGFGEIAAASW
jgi:CRISPR-associated protein Cmr3